MCDKFDIRSWPFSAAFRLTLLGLLLGPTVRAYSQTCPPVEVVGTVSVADGSTPLSAASTDRTPNWCSLNAVPGWGSKAVPLCGTGTYGFVSSAGFYFPQNGGSATCTQQDPTACIVCNGGFSHSLYATLGAFDGRVYSLPTFEPVGAGTSVFYSLPPPFGGCSPATFVQTNSAGYFDLRPASEPERTNNWAVPLSAGANGQPGSATYSFRTPTCGDFATGTLATTTSSRLETVDLFIVSPGTEDPSIRCEDPNQSGPEPTLSPPPEPEPTAEALSCAVGCPVSVTTGNMFLDQTDAAVPGVGTGLKFVRSYNSSNRGPNQYGILGPGWMHSYEKRLTVHAPNVLLLRKSNGVPAYYQDVDQDLTYKASLPFTLENWIVKQGDGSYILQFRKGGSETYDSLGRLRKLTDRAGNEAILAYDGAGLLQTITDEGTRALTLG